MQYKHFDEQEVAHGLVRGGITCYGVRWEGVTEHTAQRAFSYITQIKNYPDDVDTIYEAIYFARNLFQKPIRIPKNHFNAETVRDLMRDTNTFINTKSRNYSMDRLALLLTKDDGSTDDKLVTHHYSYQLTKLGLAEWTTSVDGVIDMLCVISTLTKLLQK